MAKMPPTYQASDNEMMINILFRSEHLLVVDKPYGISIHNDEDPSNLITLLQKQERIHKVYPIHRLDKETSGLQIFGLDSESASRYSRLFQDRGVSKKYVGILKGNFIVKKGLWNQPLTDKSEGRTNPAGISSQRIPCQTEYRVTRENTYFSFCEFNLLTGRQHQIRKHSALAKHPIVGDTRYGEKSYNQRIEKIYSQSRMFLHCNEIELDGQIYQSELPKEFNLLISHSSE
jgi:tRNA pseudouridine65 synthase